MEWAQVFTFLGINIALFGAMATLVIWAVNKTDNDVKSIGSRLDGHAQRIDQLYGIIVQMLKEKK